jgi:hypothetical protein
MIDQGITPNPATTAAQVNAYTTATNTLGRSLPSAIVANPAGIAAGPACAVSPVAALGAGAAAAQPQAAAVAQNIGTLPAGKRVIVTFDVVIANPLPAGVTQLSNQATISGANFADVLSDDPDQRGTADPTITDLRIIRQSYLPLIERGADVPLAPDLVVTSVSLTPNKTTFTAGESVLITIVIKNQGTAASATFWTDLYLNPSTTPALNKVWNELCGITPCFGLAWAVSRELAPGESITLTSQVGSFGADYSVWKGWFASGTTDLYVLADSWNSGIPKGASGDSNMANNLFHLGGLRVTGINPRITSVSSAGTLPTRPAAAGR